MDVRERIELIKTLEKIAEHREYCDSIGVRDGSFMCGNNINHFDESLLDMGFSHVILGKFDNTRRNKDMAK